MTDIYARRMLLAGVPSFLFMFGLAAWLRGSPLGVDSSVYRAGAALFLHGHSPYQANDLGYLHQSFTYPPAAALLLSPLGFLPAQLAWAVMASASILALALVIRVAVAQVPYWRFPAGWSTLLLTAAMLCLLPVYHTVGLGQVNLLLMAMVTLDVLALTARRSRWGGLLTGIAASVFLVPLIFIPHLLLTGKRTAAARALAVFAGLQGLALVIAPQDSIYWTTYVFQIGRIGHAQIPDNQSLDGLIERLSDVSAWSVYAAWAIGALLAVPALMLMLRCHRRGQGLVALCVTAWYGLLVTPISWRPTWVWVAPVIVALLSWLQLTWFRAQRGRSSRWRCLAGVGAVIVVIAVFTATPVSRTTQQRPRTLSPFWFFVLSNPYVLTTIAIAVVLAACLLRRTGRWSVSELGEASDVFVAASAVRTGGVTAVEDQMGWVRLGSAVCCGWDSPEGSAPARARCRGGWRAWGQWSSTRMRSPGRSWSPGPTGWAKWSRRSGRTCSSRTGAWTAGGSPTLCSGTRISGPG
jgi:alpha-1,2-mannosyltransferase